MTWSRFAPIAAALTALLSAVLPAMLAAVLRLLVADLGAPTRPKRPCLALQPTTTHMATQDSAVLQLPLDVWMHVARYLRPRDAVALAETSRAGRAIAHSLDLLTACAPTLARCRTAEALVTTLSAWPRLPLVVDVAEPVLMGALLALPAHARLYGLRLGSVSFSPAPAGPWLAVARPFLPHSLRRIVIDGSAALHDINSLAGIDTVVLRDCPNVRDLQPLARGTRRASLVQCGNPGAPPLDLAPLAGLAALSLSGLRVINLAALDDVPELSLEALTVVVAQAAEQERPQDAAFRAGEDGLGHDRHLQLPDAANDDGSVAEAAAASRAAAAAAATATALLSRLLAGGTDDRDTQPASCKQKDGYAGPRRREHSCLRRRHLALTAPLVLEQVRALPHAPAHRAAANILLPALPTSPLDLLDFLPQAMSAVAKREMRPLHRRRRSFDTLLLPETLELSGLSATTAEALAGVRGRIVLRDWPLLHDVTALAGASDVTLEHCPALLDLRALQAVPLLMVFACPSVWPIPLGSEKDAATAPAGRSAWLQADMRTRNYATLPAKTPTTTVPSSRSCVISPTMHLQTEADNRLWGVDW